MPTEKASRSTCRDARKHRAEKQASATLKIRAPLRHTIPLSVTTLVRCFDLPGSVKALLARPARIRAAGNGTSRHLTDSQAPQIPSGSSYLLPNRYDRATCHWTRTRELVSPSGVERSMVTTPSASRMARWVPSESRPGSRNALTGSGVAARVASGPPPTRWASCRPTSSSRACTPAVAWHRGRRRYGPRRSRPRTWSGARVASRAHPAGSCPLSRHPRHHRRAGAPGPTSRAAPGRAYDDKVGRFLGDREVCRPRAPVQVATLAVMPYSAIGSDAQSRHDTLGGAHPAPVETRAEPPPLVALLLAPCRVHEHVAHRTPHVLAHEGFPRTGAHNRHSRTTGLAVETSRRCGVGTGPSRVRRTSTPAPSWWSCLTR